MAGLQGSAMQIDHKSLFMHKYIVQSIFLHEQMLSIQFSLKIVISNSQLL